jgi:hypothetical protein
LEDVKIAPQCGTPWDIVVTSLINIAFS